VLAAQSNAAPSAISTSPRLTSVTRCHPTDPELLNSGHHVEVSAPSCPTEPAVSDGSVCVDKGLRLPSTGVLSGTPSKKLTAGQSSITVKATEKVITLNGMKKVTTTTTIQATIPLAIT
jgi:hypothetical protein